MILERRKQGRLSLILKVPEVFKNEKAGKVKVDEGRSGGGRADEGDDKPFCFRCNSWDMENWCAHVS
jgi:hypothetical protein